MYCAKSLYQLTKIQVVENITSQTTNEGVSKFILNYHINTVIHKKIYH